MSSVAAWKPQLVAIDVDGTLLDPATQTISMAARAAVRRATEAGAHIVIATGRSMLGTLPVLDELDLSSGVAVCSNGAVRIDATTRKATHVITFDPAPVFRVLEELLPGTAFVAEQLGTGSLVTAPFDEAELHGPQQLATAEELTSAPVPRLIARWTGHSSSELVERLRTRELPGVTATIDDWLPWVTMVASGVSKGTILEDVRVELGVAGGNTLAIGDGDNDIQMLRWAGHGVAMGQAAPIVREAADEVTESVTNDGLAATLKRWF